MPTCNKCNKVSFCDCVFKNTVYSVCGLCNSKPCSCAKKVEVEKAKCCSSVVKVCYSAKYKVIAPTCNEDCQKPLGCRSCCKTTTNPINCQSKTKFSKRCMNGCNGSVKIVQPKKTECKCTKSCKKCGC